LSTILRFGVATLLVCAAVAARGEPTVLRFGTIAPDGTAWSRIAKATGQALADATGGQATTKWYFNGVAGDEVQMAERVRKEQLDGIVSGGMLCERLSPSMRVLRLVGLFQTRDESGYVAGRLKSVFDEEFRKAGFVNLGEIGVGPDLVFSRDPIRSMDELRRARLWTWDLDDVYSASWPRLGVHIVPTRIDEAYRAYEERRLDGFIAVPTAALGFQWSTEARYVTNLRVSFLRACILISTRAFDSLSLEARNALLTSSAKGMMQLEELGRSQDAQLLGTPGAPGLFARQGLTIVPVSEGFRSEFFSQARAVRDEIASRLVPKELLQRVLGLLADYRAEHRAIDRGKSE
jgi:TRAP-type transport system periplasmic protein